MKWIAIGLFLVNLIVGLLCMNEGLFHCDSVILTQAVEKTYHTGILQPSIDGRYGSVILNFIIALPWLLSGLGADLATRLSSILFHSLSIAALFIFIKELFDDINTGFFTALLFSFTPLYFSPNTYGKEHGASIFFVLLSLILLSRALKKDSSFLIILSSAAFVFSMTIRQSTLAFAPLFFLFYFSPEIYTNPVKISILGSRLKLKLLFPLVFSFFASIVIVCILYLNAELVNFLNTEKYHYAKFIGVVSPVLKKALKDLFFSIPPLLFVFLSWGIYIVAKQKNKFLLFFMLSWSMLILFYGNLNVYALRYLDIVIIPIYALSAYALSKLYKKSKVISLVMVIFSVLGMFASTSSMLEFRHRYNGEKRFALYVLEKTPPNSRVIAQDESPFIQYYAKRITILPPAYGGKPEINNFILQIKDILAKGYPVYLISTTFAYDPSGELAKALLNNFNVFFVGRHLNDEYHRSEIHLYLMYEGLYKISLKN